MYIRFSLILLQFEINVSFNCCVLNSCWCIHQCIIDQYKDLKNQSFKLFDDMKTAPGQIFYMIQNVKGFRLWFNKFMFKNAYI